MGADCLAEGSIIGDRYRLVSRLGAGSGGVVYRAERVKTGRVVAIKLLQSIEPDVVQRFKRELSVASRLSHPHLVEVLDSGQQDGVPYMVMEYAAGQPLSALLARGSLPPPRASGIVRQILAGVHYAHTGGVVHRDLKPD